MYHGDRRRASTGFERLPPVNAKSVIAIEVCDVRSFFVLFFRVRASTGFERVSPVNVKSVIQTEIKYEMSVVFFLHCEKPCHAEKY